MKKVISQGENIKLTYWEDDMTAEWKIGDWVIAECEYTHKCYAKGVGHETHYQDTLYYSDGGGRNRAAMKRAVKNRARAIAYGIWYRITGIDLAEA